MFLKSLNDSQLMNRFHKMVRTERKITHLVLECIGEIDRRKIYLQKAHSSLYEFLVKDFGYSPSAALRRIESARLLREVPEVSQKVEDGSLNLSQLSKVQQALRTVLKTENKKLDIDEKRNLLCKIENTTQEKTELILAQELNLTFQPTQKTKIHRDESVTLTITLSREQMKTLKLASDFISHSVPENDWAKTLTYLAQKELDRRTKCKTSSHTSATSTISLSPNPSQRRQPAPTALHKPLQPTLGKPVAESLHTSLPPTLRKPIPLGLRKTLLNPSARCEFKNPQSGKICGGQRFLQIDHIQPVWAGGTNSPANLQVLCAQHNQFKHQQELQPPPLRR